MKVPTVPREGVRANLGFELSSEPGLSLSGTLLKVCGERRHSFGDTSFGLPWRRHRGTLFQGPEQWSIHQTIGLQHRGKTVASADSVDPSLLSRTKYLHRQGFE